jgi:AcrR family transcriptional regulator
MTPQRHILDAAHDCVLDIGMRRTTLAEVARRAGISRMTVYRQYGDLNTLISALLTRELTALMAEVDAELHVLATARERLIEACVQIAERMHDHPLYRRILDLDPELLLPLIVDRFGSTQVAAMALVAERIREGHDDGSLTELDPESGATAVLLLCQSFVISARLLDPSVAKELRPMLEGYLR